MQRYGILLLVLHFCLNGLPLPLEAQTFAPFKELRKGWYFNQVNGDAVVGLSGPFEDLKSCQKQERLKAKTSGACYERETLEYYLWKQQRMRAWVLPVRTGKDSQYLVMPSKEDCHRVISSGFYFGEHQQKILLPPEWKYCLITSVSFEEVESRYRFTNKHPPTRVAMPQKYKAWSLAVEKGQLIRLLQFSGKGDQAKAHCDKVAAEGHYYSWVYRNWGKLRVERNISKGFDSCEKRAPYPDELPILYEHMEHHVSKTSQTPTSPKPKNNLRLWMLAIEKRVDFYPLLFESKEACEQVMEDGYYYAAIDRGGVIPKLGMKVSFKGVAEACTLKAFPKEVESRIYAFTSWH